MNKITQLPERRFQFATHSVDETIRWGSLFGSLLRGGDVLGLVGRLGAGKTHFVKGLARGLGFTDDRNVNSPTFVLVNEYEARLPIRHVDAYRLGSASELHAIGIDEMIEAGAVTIVEWADRVAEALPARTLWIEIETPGESNRDFSISSADAEWGTRLATLGLTDSAPDAITPAENP